jgi:hypothetical protein
MIAKSAVLIGGGEYIAPRHVKAINDTGTNLLGAIACLHTRSYCGCYGYGYGSDYFDRPPAKKSFISRLSKGKKGNN